MIKPSQHLAQTRASLCVDTEAAITCGGRRFVPDDDLAYVEFYLGRSYPVVITDGTALHPQVVANSYRSLEGKVFNLCHLMRSNDPQRQAKDRILGYVAAVEFPEPPAGGWLLQADADAAPEIRAVAAMHKAAHGVGPILQSWERGENLFSRDPWTVSMENWSDPSEGCFLVRVGDGPCVPELASFLKSTPADAWALGFVCVPAMSAPDELLRCVNTAEDDAADGTSLLRVKRSYRGLETVFLVGGMAGAIRFSGTALTPKGKEGTARVAQMLAGEPMVDLGPVFESLDRFLQAVKAPPAG